MKPSSLAIITVIAMLLTGCGKPAGVESEAPAGAVAEQQAAPEPSSIDQAESLEMAKAAVQEFAGALKAELMAAMQEGGPVAAIGICNTRAMPITRKVSEQHGLSLGRVSLRNRNPANAPNEWQARVLEEFEQRKAAGEDPAAIAWSEVTQTGSGTEFRFMKAIPTGEMCLLCHGTEISPEIHEILATLYPHDRATGFEVGDIRGAFVVTR
jgi:hypothetical protein